MKYRIRWQATYETFVEADSPDVARDEAGNIEIDVPGSRYIEDSWEVLSLEDVKV